MPSTSGPEPDVSPLRDQNEAVGAAVDELRRLVSHGRAAIVGPVRQELLSGIHERAADCFNLCRAKGIQGSNTDFLLRAVAERFRFPILTTDEDFLKFGRVLPLRLHALDT